MGSNFKHPNTSFNGVIKYLREKQMLSSKPDLSDKELRQMGHIVYKFLEGKTKWVPKKGSENTIWMLDKASRVVQTKWKDFVDYIKELKAS